MEDFHILIIPHIGNYIVNIQKVQTLIIGISRAGKTDSSEQQGSVSDIF